VPGLFAWLRKRYPVAQVLSKRSGEWEGSAAVDNLYIGKCNRDSGIWVGVRSLTWFS
jgi:hypothetical protein